MIMQFDLINETVLIMDKKHHVVDIFEVLGPTQRERQEQAVFFTYRSHLTPEKTCVLCAKTISQLDQPCVSNSGNHAIVGRALTEIPNHHRATSYDLPLIEIRFQEFIFYLEKDNLFLIDEKSETGNNPDPLEQKPDSNSFNV